MRAAPFPVIHATGTPYDLGRIHGEAASAAIERSLAFYEQALPATGAIALGQVCDEVARHADRWRAEEPDLSREVEGIADGAGKSVREILALNCRDTYMHRTATAVGDAMDDGCTSYAVVQSPEGPVLSGQNWDYLEPIAETIVLLHLRPHDQPAQLVIVEAGQVGRQGANAVGLALQANGLPSADRDAAALPPTFLRRRVLRAGELETALAAAIGTARGGRVNLLVSSRDGIALDLELDRTTCRWLEPDAEGLLVHANHFDAEIPAGLRLTYRPDPGSLLRRARALQLLRAHARTSGPIDRTTLQGVGRDHAGGPGGICQHPRDLPTLERWLTVASTVTELASGTMWVAPGPPCQHRYVAFDIASGEPLGGEGDPFETGAADAAALEAVPVVPSQGTVSQ